MLYSSIKATLVFLLVFALNYAQIAPGLAGANHKKVRVAFVGIKFEEMPKDVQERILERVREAIESQAGLQFIKPAEAEKALGPEKIAAFFNQPDSAAFRALIDGLQADFLIAGRIANQSRDPKRILLVGEISRFDRATNLFHKFEILKYYDNFGVELVKFKQEYVETMNPTATSGKQKWVWLVLGGVTIAGIVAMTLSSIKAGAEGEGSPAPIRRRNRGRENG